MMLQPEHILAPFSVSELPPGPWLVFAPHSDDETFGMGGSLLKASCQGIETHVLVLTDGALGGHRENLVSIRQSEVKEAARVLGVKGLRLWSEPDRGLVESDSLKREIAELICEVQPKSVFFPGPLELHPDHRATGFLVWSALQMTYPSGLKPFIHSYEISVQNPINILIDITEQMPEKVKAMQIYASQNQENNYPDLVTALNRSRTLTLPPDVKYSEGFFQYSEKDLEISLRDMTHHIINLYQ